MSESVILGLRGCRAFHQDLQWWLALLAGPVFWLLWSCWHPPLPGWPAALELLSLVLLQPLIEELVFRGMVQGYLLQTPWGRLRLGGFTSANLLTAMLFTGLHALSHTPAWALAVFLPALVFGYFRERSGCIYAPLLLHAAYNLGYFLLWPA